MPDRSGSGVYRYLYLGSELAILVAAGVWLGQKLDGRWNCAPWCLLAGAAAGFAAGMYLLIRESAGSEDRSQDDKKQGG